MPDKTTYEYKYDVFISHATEDKESFVRKFATRLLELGIKVWYDEFSLRIGDSLSRSIDKGLIESRYGIVILSNSFVKKTWPDYELRSLLALQSQGDRRILPVWHDIDREVLLQYSPILADIVALNTQQGLETVALQILNVVQPEIYEGIVKWLRYQRIKTQGKAVSVPAKELVETAVASPHRRNKLTEGQLRRVRLICSLLQLEFEEMYDGFLRDMDAEHEIQIWEGITLVVHLYRERSHCAFEEASPIISLLLFANLYELAKQMNEDVKTELRKKTNLDVELLAAIVKETNQHPNLSDTDDPFWGYRTLRP